ncbi:MAG: hypothetical protein SGBAC_005067 [Bacillariaceae sp.]
MALLYYVFVWSMISLVYGDVFTVPTAFLARKHHENKMIWESPLDIRGGGPKESRKEEDEDEQWEDVYDEEEEEEEEEDEMTVEEDFAEALEEEFKDALQEEEELVEEEEELAEEEENPSTEEVSVAVEDVSTLEERTYTDDENSLSFVDSMEARISNTNTDDENSSAFVDRMELADAYDEVDAIADQEDDSALAAVTAATAIGGDDSIAEDEAVGEDESSAVVPVEVSQEIKDALKGLKYKSREIGQLRPEVATELAEKGLQRPQEGLPQNWLVEGASGSCAIREQALKVSVILAALGGLAFVGAKGDIGGLIAGVPAALKSLLPAKSAPVAESSTSPLITETEVSLVEEKEEEDDHPHSVKPNSTSPPVYEEHLDRSWLDKVITQVGSVFKAFWNAKI